MHHKEMAYKEKSSAEDAMMSVIDQKVDEWKVRMRTDCYMQIEFIKWSVGMHFRKILVMACWGIA